MSGITKINGQSGSAQKCIEYLEGMTQSNGNDRDFAPVNEISGDKNLFLAVAESTERKNKYVSGTISFQQPLTEQQFKSVIKEFHQTFLPELKQGEDFADYWNIHQKKNGQFELNFAIATTHIKSGKQLNPFPPGMESRELKDLFDSVVNHELGLNQVNQIEIKLDENGNPIKTDSYSFQNPMKTSTYNLLKQFNSIKVKNEDGKLVLPENKTDFFKQLKSMQQQKDFVADYVRDKILDGTINNRLDLKNSLGDLGTITRENDFTVSIKLDGKDKAIRLNGPMFEFKTDYDELKQSFKNSIHQNKNANQKLDNNKASLIKKRKNDLVESRGNFYKKVHSTKRVRNKSSKRKLKLGKNQKKVFEKLGYKFKDKDKKDGKDEPKHSNSSNQLPLSKKDGPASGASETVKANMEMSKEVSTDKAKDDLKEIKSENKSNENKKPTDPKISSSSKSSSSNDDKPSLPSSNSSGGSAVQSLEKEIASFDKQIISLNNSMISIQLRIGSLNMMKESDIRLKFELQGKIAELQIKINEEVAKREVKASALAQAKQDELNKNNKYTPAKPKM